MPHTCRSRCPLNRVETVESGHPRLVHKSSWCLHQCRTFDAAGLVEDLDRRSARHGPRSGVESQCDLFLPVHKGRLPAPASTEPRRIRLLRSVRSPLNLVPGCGF